MIGPCVQGGGKRRRGQDSLQVGEDGHVPNGRIVPRGQDRLQGGEDDLVPNGRIVPRGQDSLQADEDDDHYYEEVEGHGYWGENA